MKKNPKILFITPYYYPNLKGGSERSLKLLAEGLAKKGLDINILSFDGNEKIKREKFFGVRVIRVKSPGWKPKTLALNFELNKYKSLIRKESPDIIHIYNTWQIPAAVKLKKYAKVVATLNNYYPLIAISYTKDNLIESGDLSFSKTFKSTYLTLNGNFIKKFLLSTFYTLYGKLYINPNCKKLDAYIAYSEAVKNIYEKAGYTKNKINVIRSPFVINNKNGLNLKRKNKVILYVGGALESKGFYDLINAIKLIDYKDLEFRFAGINTNNPEIQSLKNDKRLKFLGKLDEKSLAKEYLQATVLVHPSVWPEPFSRVWLEALFYNTPIISADNPIAKEVLGQAAIFYSRNDYIELAEKIKSFISGNLKIDSEKYISTRKKIFSQDPIEEVIKFYSIIK